MKKAYIKFFLIEYLELKLFYILINQDIYEDFRILRVELGNNIYRQFIGWRN
jgi:hypothetical protein